MIKRILVIINGMDVGGAETFIMKIYRSINREKYQMDFLINSTSNCFYEDEIEKLGGRIYRGVSKSKSILKCFISVYGIVRKYKYNNALFVAVHPLVVIDLLAAMIGGAKNRMVRSTNSNSKGGFLSKVASYICRPFVRCLSTVMLAPSDLAAEWMFGKGIISNPKYSMITNGINVREFDFDENKRINKREELRVQKFFVVGHVGRFNKQKNHEYLLDVFRQLLVTKPESVLLLVGIGELETDVRQKAYELGISDKIIFAGIRTDVNELLMAMDVLVFPSLYEGMPNVVIEAQATGLPCIVSDTITKQVQITDLVKFESLGNVEKWTEEILNIDLNRRSRIDEIIEKGYSIEKTAGFIQGHLV